MGSTLALMALYATSTSHPSKAFGTFPDAHEMPISGWTGPVFKLSQTYPTVKPSSANLPWKSIDFKTQSEQYGRAVLNYCLQGNTAIDFDVANNTVRKWYHVPWMHWHDGGREFVHGMTRERTSRVGELAPTQTSQAQNWAVGFYNGIGGYTVGKVWANPLSPDATVAKFGKGTVSFKLLFTAAPVAQVPYLNGSLEWDAFINTSLTSTSRSIQKVRLVQIDIAVRDTRANSTTGWVFGTFVYNDNAPGTTVWDKMVFRGLQWGNDPGVAPGGTLNQGIVSNTNIPSGLHAGYGGRLNGPVDNPASSCLSCHATAQTPGAPMVPASTATPPQIMAFFQNIKAAHSYDSTGQIGKPLDYSLQLAAGIKYQKQATGQVSPMAAPPAMREGLTTTSNGLGRINHQ